MRPAGAVVVSDIYWHHTPEQALGPEWGWFAQATMRLSLDEYRRVLTDCGLQVQAVYLHDEAAWEAYHRPMRRVVAEERARAEAAFADEVERGIEVERRGVEAFVGYVTFLARNRA